MVSPALFSLHNTSYRKRKTETRSRPATACARPSHGPELQSQPARIASALPTKHAIDHSLHPCSHLLLGWRKSGAESTFTHLCGKVRVPQMQTCQFFRYSSCHDKIPVPLMVRRDDGPWSPLG